eukprot:scaffold246238_cov38-Tisochrysis_lutea.AAC.3
MSMHSWARWRSALIIVRASRLRSCGNSLPTLISHSARSSKKHARIAHHNAPTTMQPFNATVYRVQCDYRAVLPDR